MTQKTEIRKYPLGAENSLRGSEPFFVHIDMPESATILHVNEQDGKVFVWAEVPPSDYSRPVRLYLIGTNHRIPGDASLYIGHFSTTMGKIWDVYTGNYLSRKVYREGI
jgi:hypothetical protein